MSSNHESMDKEKLLEEIGEFIDDNIQGKHYFMAGDYPEFGEIVLAYRFMGMNYEFNNQFFRIVQIRVGSGQFKSDMYLGRKPDGQLITIENQSFRRIPEQYKEAVSRHFETDLEYEKEGLIAGYSVRQDAPCVGFIIHDSGTEPSPDTSFSITISKE